MKKNRGWLHLLVFVAIGLFALGPLLVTLAAGSFASAFDCTLHEGFVNPCVVGGKDYGETLYALGLAAWATLFTLPVGLVLGALYALVLLVLWLRRRAKTPTS